MHAILMNGSYGNLSNLTMGCLWAEVSHQRDRGSEMWQCLMLLLLWSTVNIPFLQSMRSELLTHPTALVIRGRRGRENPL